MSVNLSRQKKAIVNSVAMTCCAHITFNIIVILMSTLLGGNPAKTILGMSISLSLSLSSK